MKLGYEDGRITCEDFASRPVVLENVGGLTEKTVSEIIQNANIGEQVVKLLEGRNWDIWSVCNLVECLKSAVEKERREHWARCRNDKMPGTHFSQIMEVR